MTTTALAPKRRTDSRPCKGSWEGTLGSCVRSKSRKKGPNLRDEATRKKAIVDFIDSHWDETAAREWIRDTNEGMSKYIYKQLDDDFQGMKDIERWIKEGPDVAESAMETDTEGVQQELKDIKKSIELYRKYIKLAPHLTDDDIDEFAYKAEDEDEKYRKKPRTDDATPVKRILKWQGFEIGLQYLPFEKRHGRVLPAAYGHFRRTRGADGMAVDVYVGTNLASPLVFVVDQVIDGAFDEEKMIIGVNDAAEARMIYGQAMPKEFFGGMREIPLAELEEYRVPMLTKSDANPRRRKKGCNDDCECEPCQKARKDALEEMLKMGAKSSPVRRLQRTDDGKGKECGASHISPSKTCHIGSSSKNKVLGKISVDKVLTNKGTGGDFKPSEDLKRLADFLSGEKDARDIDEWFGEELSVKQIQKKVDIANESIDFLNSYGIGSFYELEDKIFEISWHLGTDKFDKKITAPEVLELHDRLKGSGADLDLVKELVENESKAGLKSWLKEAQEHDDDPEYLGKIQKTHDLATDDDFRKKYKKFLKTNADRLWGKAEDENIDSVETAVNERAKAQKALDPDLRSYYKEFYASGDLDDDIVEAAENWLWSTVEKNAPRIDANQRRWVGTKPGCKRAKKMLKDHIDKAPGKPCGKSFISAKRRCSKEKSKQTAAAIKARGGVEKLKQRQRDENELKRQVKRAKGQKARSKAEPIKPGSIESRRNEKHKIQQADIEKQLMSGTDFDGRVLSPRQGESMERESKRLSQVIGGTWTPYSPWAGTKLNGSEKQNKWAAELRDEELGLIKENTSRLKDVGISGLSKVDDSDIDAIQREAIGILRKKSARDLINSRNEPFYAVQKEAIKKYLYELQASGDNRLSPDLAQKISNKRKKDLKAKVSQNRKRQVYKSIKLKELKATSEKQRNFANRTREDILSSAASTNLDPADVKKVVETTERLSKASWWLDNRHLGAEALRRVINKELKPISVFDSIDVLTMKLDAKTGTPCNNQRGWVGTKPGCKRAKPGTATRVRRIERKRMGKNPEPPKARTITAAEKAERRGQLSLFPADKPQPVRSQKKKAPRGKDLAFEAAYKKIPKSEEGGESLDPSAPQSFGDWVADGKNAQYKRIKNNPDDRSKWYRNADDFFISELEGYDTNKNGKVTKVEIFGEKPMPLKAAYRLATEKYNQKYSSPQKNAAKRMGQGGATLKIKEPPAEVIKAAKKKAAAGERKNLTNEFNQKIKAVRAIEDPDERARQARELAMEAEKLESRWGRDQGLSSIRKKAANLSREMFRRTEAPQPKRANTPVRLSKKQGESTLFRGPDGSYFSIDSREWDAAVDALAKVDGSYTKPQIRERLKNKIKAGSKGGPAGRWSARKSQLLANEYKKAGGGYRGPRTQEQKSQANWNDENWDYVTPEDKKKPRAERGRYLPKAARENLTAGEKRATNAAKRKATQSGEPSSAQPERIAQKTAKYRSDTQGTLISTLPRRNGKVKYRGQWWTIDKDIAATQKGKKRQVLAKKGDRVMLIAFGDKDYRHNYSTEAKANYLNRSAGIRDKDGNLTKDDPWSPNYWSRKVLWPKGDAA